VLDMRGSGVHKNGVEEIGNEAASSIPAGDRHVRVRGQIAAGAPCQSGVDLDRLDAAAERNHLCANGRIVADATPDMKKAVARCEAEDIKPRGQRCGFTVVEPPGRIEGDEYIG